VHDFGRAADIAGVRHGDDHRHDVEIKGFQGVVSEK
jgi:hypothetical protein